MGGLQTTISKNRFTRLSGISVLAAALFFAVAFAHQAEVFAHNIDTSATVSFSANPATDGDTVTITGRVTISGDTHGAVGDPVTSGTIKIEELMLGGVGVPVGTVGAGWVEIGSGSPDSNVLKSSYTGRVSVTVTVEE